MFPEMEAFVVPPERTIESPLTSLTASSAEGKILETVLLASKRATLCENARAVAGGKASYNSPESQYGRCIAL